MMRVIVLGLLAALVASAYGVATTQHEHRRHFALWQKANERTDALNVEWGQLQIEIGALSTHNVIERQASQRFGMRFPAEHQIVYVAPDKVSDGQ